jgi:hypothetical protein
MSFDLAKLFWFALGILPFSLEPYYAHTPCSRFGASLSSLSRADGPAIIVGSPAEAWDDHNSSGLGVIRIYDGSSAALIRTIQGSGQFGSQLLSVPDSDGDGYDDIITVAQVGMESPTKIVLFSGERFERIAEWEFSRMGFGRIHCLRSPGDDCLLIVPSHGVNGVAGASIISVKSKSLVHRMEAEGYAPWCSALRDIDQDGYSEFMLRSYAGTESKPGELSLFVYSGGTLKLMYIIKADAGYLPNIAATSMADINADSIDDIAIGFTSQDRARPGRVVLYSGADGAQIREIRINSKQDLFGWSIERIGDIDRDGIDDLAASAYVNVFRGIDRGIGIIYSGRNMHEIVRHYGDEGEPFGCGVFKVVDCDGDDVLDYAITRFEADPGAFDVGSVYIYSGASRRQIAHLRCREGL